jgi:hypothetical protein
MQRECRARFAERALRGLAPPAADDCKRCIDPLTQADCVLGAYDWSLRSLMSAPLTHAWRRA